MIELSIIIPTFNRFNVLQKTLASLEQQKLPKNEFEVIIINDGSDEPLYEQFDKLKTQFAQLQLILMTQKRSGAAVARNCGIEKAQGKYILFLGDDMLAHPYLLKEHLKSHETYPNDSILGFIDWDANLPINDVMRFIAPYGPQFNYQLADPGNCSFWMFYTSNLSVPKSLLEQEPFSTEFPGCCYEDVDLGYRLQKKGMKLVYNPMAITYHHHYHDEVTFTQRQHQAGRNLNVFLRLHPEFKKNFILSNIKRAHIRSTWKRIWAKIKRDQKLYYHHTFELAWMKGYLKNLHLSDRSALSM